MVFITPALFHLSLISFSKNKQEKPISDENDFDDENLPWYLKKKSVSVYFFCIVLPPIGYLIVLSNLKKLDYKPKINYLTVATVVLTVWLLKFLPDSARLYLVSFILGIIIGNMLLKLIDKQKLESTILFKIFYSPVVLSINF